MAEPITCPHCHEPHPATTAFCPNTGKPMSTAGVGSPPPFAGAPSGEGRVSPPPPPPAATRVTSGGSHARSSSKSGPSSVPSSVPDWVTDPQAGSSDVGGVGEQADKGVLDLLQQALALYKQHAKMLLTVAAVVFVPGAVAHACARAAILAPTMAVAVALDPVTHLPISAPFATTSVVAGFTVVLLGLLAAGITGLFLHGIIIPLVHGALALAAGDRMAGGSAGWREVWRWLFRRLGVVLSAIIPAALLTGIGFFFLVVPGLLLAFFFAFVPTVALFEGVGGRAALRRSSQLVRSDWLRMLLMLIVFGVISGIAQSLSRALFGGLFLSRLVQDALTLLAMPIPVLGSVLLYFDIRRKHDGFDQTRLAAEMDAIRAA